jgi:ectoine hydroxylase-related dioxygenase (phytanoyl-CoA dioxygenase family)
LKEEAQSKTSGWHRDRWAQVPRGADYTRPLAINAISYLQDLTEAFGPLRVVPGSHRKPITVPPEARTAPRPDEMVVNMKAGDVVVIHNALLHSGTPNTSGELRFFFSIFYNLTWLKHTDIHSGPNVQHIVRQARARNDRRILRLFGEDDLLERRANSGFMEDDETLWERWIEEDRAALVSP